MSPSLDEDEGSVRYGICSCASSPFCGVSCPFSTLSPPGLPPPLGQKPKSSPNFQKCGSACHLPAVPSSLSPPRSLCSSHVGFLTVPPTHQAQSCPRAFVQAVPSTWPAFLPDILRFDFSSPLKSQLKRHFFSHLLLDLHLNAPQPPSFTPSRIPPLLIFSE